MRENSYFYCAQNRVFTFTSFRIEKIEEKVDIHLRLKVCTLSAAMDRYEAVVRTYGKENFEKIQKAKLLVVGAGGIGCEVTNSNINEFPINLACLNRILILIDTEKPCLDWFQVHRADRPGHH